MSKETLMDKCADCDHIRDRHQMGASWCRDCSECQQYVSPRSEEELRGLGETVWKRGMLPEMPPLSKPLPLRILADDLRAGRAPAVEWIAEHAPTGSFDELWRTCTDARSMCVIVGVDYEKLFPRPKGEVVGPYARSVLRGMLGTFVSALLPAEDPRQAQMEAAQNARSVLESGFEIMAEMQRTSDHVRKLYSAPTVKQLVARMAKPS